MSGWWKLDRDVAVVAHRELVENDPARGVCLFTLCDWLLNRDTSIMSIMSSVFLCVINCMTGSRPGRLTMPVWYSTVSPDPSITTSIAHQIANLVDHDRQGQATTHPVAHTNCPARGREKRVEPGPWPRGLRRVRERRAKRNERSTRFAFWPCPKSSPASRPTTIS